MPFAVLLYLVQNPAWWRFRAPDQPGGSPICLPDDPRVRAELAAPRWTLEPRGVVVESKDEHQNAARQITRCR
jgi:hypothetical protein